MKKQMLVFILMLLFLCVNAYAANVEVRAEPQNYKVEAGGVAEWTLYVKNNQVRSDIYRISADDLSLPPFSNIIKSVVIKPNQMEIKSLGETEVNVKIYLQEDLVADKEYGTFVWVKSLTNPEIKQKVDLNNFIISTRELIDIKADLSKNIVPGQVIPFDVTFKNRGNKELENLDVYVASSVFNDRKKLSLGPYESMKTSFNFDISSVTLPGEYSMSIRAYQGESLKGIADFSFTIVKNPNIIEEDVVEKKILKTSTILNRENKGNTLIEIRARHPVSFLKRIFTSTEPDAKIMKFSDGKFYVWDLRLEPGDKKIMTVTTNYRIIPALILLLFIGFLALHYFKGKNITINKTLFRMKDEKNNVTELKILLHIKNNTDKDIYNLKVIDLLPNLIIPTSEFATLKPERIQKGNNGIRIIWNIPKLEKNEERVISYKVHSRLPIVGEVELPSASIQYRPTPNKVLNIQSNKLVFSKQ